MFLEEEDLDLTLLIDASASMQFGEPPKLRAAAQIAGALGYVGLSNFDRVSASFFGETLRSGFPPSRGKAATGRLFRFLETGEPAAKPIFRSCANDWRFRPNAAALQLSFPIFSFLKATKPASKPLRRAGLKPPSCNCFRAKSWSRV
jgi:uncharacterized protein (DUF58 family)